MRTSERAVFEAIRFLACDPEIVPAQETTSVLTAEPFRGRYRISEEGRNDTEFIGLTALVDHLNYRVTYLSLQAKPHAGILHAALVRHGNRRVLITGREAAGKTTLARTLLGAWPVRTDGPNALVVDGARGRDVHAALGRGGVWADEVRVEHADLEDAFLHLTGGDEAELNQ